QATSARIINAVGISANVATIIAVVAGVLSGIAFALDRLTLAIAMLAVSAALDALDGTIARECGGAPTPFGGVMDLSFARVVEVAVMVGIVWAHRELSFYAMALVASWYVNITVFLAVGAAMEKGGPKLIEYPPGILERTEALLFFVILALAASSRWAAWMGP